MNDVFRIHETARIRTGKYSGLVGTVTDTKNDEAGKQNGVRVLVEGVRNGESVNAHVWLKRSAVERNQ